MEHRHLRYFVAVCEASSFNKAAARLRIAQPALSRQVQDLEDEIGVKLLQRSSSGVKLTPEGMLFLEEARELLNRAAKSVEKVRALARDESDELRVGYEPTPTTVKILPQGLAALRKSVPHVKVLLYDLSTDELINQLRNSTLELAIMVQPTGGKTPGIRFEPLRNFPLCVALSAAHPLARRKAIPLQKLAGEPLIGPPRKDHPEYYRNLDRIFAPTGLKPRVATERDSGSSLLIEVEAGRGMALCVPILKLLSSKRVVYRRVTGTTEWISTGIARSARGDLTPAAEQFCEILRTILNGRRSNQSPLRRIGMDDLLKPHLFRTE